MLLLVLEQQSLVQREDVKIDEKLFLAISNGDNEAFEKLYLKTKKSLYAYVFSITKDVYLTQDIVSDTYIKVRNAAHLYVEMDKPMAWMFTIAKRITLNYYRKDSKRTEYEKGEDINTFSYVTDPTLKIVLKAALEILNEEEREIVLLHTYAGLKHREIALDLGIGLSTELSKYHRALKKLKTYLLNEGVSV